MITANAPKVVTVLSSTPSTAGCKGTQVGTYSSTSNASCNPACQSGPSSTTAQCGASLGVPTYCCYKPTFLWTATPNPGANPTNIQAYPFISLPVMVRL